MDILTIEQAFFFDLSSTAIALDKLKLDKLKNRKFCHNKLTVTVLSSFVKCFGLDDHNIILNFSLENLFWHRFLWIKYYIDELKLTISGFWLETP